MAEVTTLNCQKPLLQSHLEATNLKLMNGYYIKNVYCRVIEAKIQRSELLQNFKYIIPKQRNQNAIKE
jgi:hypothetical protein